MFDNPPPTNLPTGAPEPDDIFAKVDIAASTPPPPPLVVSSPSATAPPLVPATPPSVAPDLPGTEVKPPLIASRKIIMIVGSVVGLLAVVGVIWGVWRFVKRAASPLPESVVSLDEEAAVPSIPTLPETPVLSEGEAPPFLPVPEAPAHAATTPTEDADGDGVLTSEEIERGTDPQNPDSDNDGLSDGEEVFTYQTDPLRPDTDNDTYKDGMEVSNGYNPKGEGKLFTVPSQ